MGVSREGREGRLASSDIEVNPCASMHTHGEHTNLQMNEGHA